ncbi:hypothetical protein [Sphingomonas sp.]|jgi:hypothetical protein|uniref:hypothetical protein n=1 Tax=Sphingomonas sp. TaxID=28214 RepID=UPI002DEB80E4|nr:hypothetical protein [Sphingomonas sp.]
MRLGETVKRQATRAGLCAALAALLLWPAFAIAQGWLRWPFAAALAVAAVSGGAILIITLSDMLTIRRSRHARPARVFDLVLGAALALPCAAGLADLLLI